jgi:DNA-binding MarR family transcriptional regulator
MFAVEQIPATCLGLHVRRASRILTQIYDDALVPVGLALNQFSLLVAIQLLDSVAITQLAQELFMDQSTLSRNLKPLEREGWVAISPGKDRRRRLVTLTPSGQRLLEQAIPLWERVQTNLLEHYGQQHWQTLLTLLAEARCLRQSEA